MEICNAGIYPLQGPKSGHEIPKKDHNWRKLASVKIPAAGLAFLSNPPNAIYMLVVERIRELCLRVTEAEGQEFEIALLELANALELYDLTQNKDGKQVS